MEKTSLHKRKLKLQLQEIMKILLIPLSSLALIACQTPKNQTPYIFEADSFITPGQKIFKKGAEAMDKNQYKKAIKLFQQVVKKTSEPDLKLGAHFNIASSYIDSGNCAKAIKPLKTIIKNSEENKKFRARSFVALLDVYDCINQQKSVIKVSQILLGKKYSKYLSFEEKKVFLPAKIARAYGLLNEAEAYAEYSNTAQKNFIYSAVEQSESLNKKKEGKLFYYLGDSKIHKLQRTLNEKNLALLLKQQIYLVRSAQKGTKTWAQNSSSQALENYLYLDKKIETTPAFKSLFRKHLKEIRSQIKKSKLPYAYRKLSLLISKLNRKWHSKNKK